jgi:hypothetical protein
MTDKTVDKLHETYYKARDEMEIKREELCPVGCRVVYKLTGTVAEVTGGSLYPDQINTTKGHMAWRYCKRVDE